MFICLLENQCVYIYVCHVWVILLQLADFGLAIEVQGEQQSWFGIYDFFLVII